jgi:hypothetical protein
MKVDFIVVMIRRAGRGMGYKGMQFVRGKPGTVA